MKKLLLILVFGLLFISCDRNDELASIYKAGQGETDLLSKVGMDFLKT